MKCSYFLRCIQHNVSVSRLLVEEHLAEVTFGRHTYCDQSTGHSSVDQSPCWLYVCWAKCHVTYCLLAICPLAKCQETNCLLANRPLAKCPLVKCLLAKYQLTNCLLAKRPLAKC